MASYGVSYSRIDTFGNVLCSFSTPLVCWTSSRPFTNITQPAIQRVIAFSHTFRIMRACRQATKPVHRLQILIRPIVHNYRGHPGTSSNVGMQRGTVPHRQTHAGMYTQTALTSPQYISDKFWLDLKPHISYIFLPFSLCVLMTDSVRRTFVRHLRFYWICKIVTVAKVQGPIVHTRAKFRRNRPSGCWDTAIFLRFFKMAVVRHLRLVKRTVGPFTKSTWWSLSLCGSWMKSTKYM